MMQHIEQFEVWHAEIEAELFEARNALADAESSLSAARTARASVAAKSDELRQAVAPLGASVAGALNKRIVHSGDELRQADGAVSRAAGAAANAQRQVADLEEALVQLDRLTSTEQLAETAQ